MSLMYQDEVGRCSFIDVLEEAVLRRRPVAVETRGGTTFIDHVVDVVTENGQDFVVFKVHPRMSVLDLRAVTRADAARH